MLEEKDNKKGNLVICKYSNGGFSEGSVYEIREDGTNRVLVVEDDDGHLNGRGSKYFDLYEPIEEVPQKFTIGSKWVTKCNITAMSDSEEERTIMKGKCIELTKETSTHYMFEDGYYVLYKDEAKLLLEQYIEPAREMTLEEIEDELGYKVRLVE